MAILIGSGGKDMKRIIFSLWFCLLITCFSLSTVHAYIVDTGPGPDSLDQAYYLDAAASLHGIAAQFNLPQYATITGIMGWLVVQKGGELLVTIRADADGLPGDIVASNVFPAPQSSVFYTIGDTQYLQAPPWDPAEIWTGPVGLSWYMGPGTYWVGFESIPGSDFGAYVTHPSVLDPLGNEAYMIGGDTAYGGLFADDFNMGVRIDGTTVPLPGSVLLLGSGLLGLAGWRRFRKS
jgi:hypothetical protein